LLRLVTTCYDLLRLVTTCYDLLRLVTTCYDLLLIDTNCYSFFHSIYIPFSDEYSPTDELLSCQGSIASRAQSDHNRNESGLVLPNFIKRNLDTKRMSSLSSISFNNDNELSEDM
jgi:hypothetical protein